jgi:O-antigen/teichoic acid export membrane protein
MAKHGARNGLRRRTGLASYLTTGGAAVWFGNFGSVGLRFALNIVVARLAGANQMGVYIALSALTYIIGRITDLGLPNAIVYFARAQKSSARRCISLCLMHSAFMLPASIVLLFFSDFLGLVGPDFSEMIASLWLLLGALSTVQLLGGLLGQLLIPLDGYKSYGLVMTTSPAIAALVCLALGEGILASEVLTAVLIGEGCAAALALGLLVRVTRRFEGAAPSPGLATIYRYAIKTYPGTSMKALGQRADRLILSWFLPASLLAAYGVGIALRDAAVLPITTQSMLLRNKLIDREQRGEARLAVMHLKRELIRWSIVAAAIAAGLALAAPVVVPALYGAEFRPAVRIFIVLSATLPMLAAATLCWTGLLSAGRAGTVTFGLILGGVLNLIALYVGAALNGVMGACWGALTASVIAAAWWLVATFRR